MISGYYWPKHFASEIVSMIKNSGFSGFWVDDNTSEVWGLFIPQKTSKTPNINLLVDIQFLGIFLWVDDDTGWGLTVTNDSRIVSRYEMLWKRNSLIIEDKELNIDKLAQILGSDIKIANSFHTDGLVIGTDKSILASLNAIFYPPDGIESLVEGDPPKLLVDSMLLPPYDDLDFRSLAELLRSNLLLFSQMYPGVTPINVP